MKHRVRGAGVWGGSGGVRDGECFNSSLYFALLILFLICPCFSCPSLPPSVNSHSLVLRLIPWLFFRCSHLFQFSCMVFLGLSLTSLIFFVHPSRLFTQTPFFIQYTSDIHLDTHWSITSLSYSTVCSSPSSEEWTVLHCPSSRHLSSVQNKVMSLLKLSLYIVIFRNGGDTTFSCPIPISIRYIVVFRFFLAYSNFIC